MKMTTMIRTQIWAILASLTFIFAATPGSAQETGNGDPTANSEYVTPVMDGYGQFVRLPDAAFQPEKDSKVVLDITSDKLEGEVIKALDRAALMLGQYADADAPIKMALVLHGSATKAVLTDAAYEKHKKSKTNPNLGLIRTLEKQGVEIFVCGQALANKRYALDEIVPEVTVALSAATAVITLQKQGYSYLPFD